MNLPVSATSPGRLVTTPATSASGIGSKHGSVLTEAVGDQLLVAVHDAYLQVGRTVIERSITRANIVLTSATASVTAYTALLGLINSTTHGRRLPAIALWPVLYLGLAVALTAFYAGYLSPRFTRFHPLPVGASQDVAEARLTMFLTWAANATMSRAWALRMALVSLSLGLVLLPVGFISFHGALAVLVQVAPASVLFLCIGIEILRRHEPEPAAKPKPAIPIPIMPEPAMPVMPTPAMPMPAAREQPSRLLIETLTEPRSTA